MRGYRDPTSCGANIFQCNNEITTFIKLDTPLEALIVKVQNADGNIQKVTLSNPPDELHKYLGLFNGQEVGKNSLFNYTNQHSVNSSLTQNEWIKSQLSNGAKVIGVDKNGFIFSENTKVYNTSLVKTTNILGKKVITPQPIGTIKDKLNAVHKKEKNPPKKPQSFKKKVPDCESFISPFDENTQPILDENKKPILKDLDKKIKVCGVVSSCTDGEGKKIDITHFCDPNRNNTCPSKEDCIRKVEYNKQMNRLFPFYQPGRSHSSLDTEADLENNIKNHQKRINEKRALSGKPQTQDDAIAETKEHSKDSFDNLDRATGSTK